MSNSILFVDDNPVSRQLLRSILSQEYNQLHEASDGQQCLNILKSRVVDLLLLDLNMPGISGFDLLQLISKLDLDNPPTVIVVSADKDPAVISQVLKGGAADYVTTPYHSDELIARVKTHLALRSREIHLEQLVIRRTKELTSTSYRLEQAQKQLIHADKMASLGQLAAGVAHEINNPVGYIHSNLMTLSDYLQDFQQYLESSKEIAKEAANEDIKKQFDELYQRLDMEYLQEDIGQIIRDTLTGTKQIKQIVTNLKGYSHPEQQEWLHHNIHDLLESSLSIVSNQLKYKVELQKRYQRDLPKVYCIGSQISQIFINLLVNAEQAIDGHGQITITTSLSRQSLNNNQPSVDICITDDGKGIDENIANRIFDPFFTTKPVGTGTGLGLSICYNIASGHGGLITMQSQPGRGTQFIVSLPIEMEAGQSALT
ncbi:response regulator [Pseudoteredinibacter isoporae]|uniref:histidine kinase n=1 Tax=Pseudoteredinibacter isoporae TaxID=570281 RepID=A0A7X0MUY9_9GAMM|nr:response regulator [Pseudoteredinibacter isoporae]MBB6521161.1 signal transduction histidine kinase [Pseudoteredinibacter isoporae]NHO86721.1 response regulator [Pseudoteredinibacter isoporae]NIB24827.1 response regulator [Pseudoteredinibacter isoporae]